MRIISNYHDYYDTAMGHGQDRTLIYLRHGEELPFDKWIFPTMYNGWCQRNTRVSIYVIGFCGKVYPVVEVIADRWLNTPEYKRPRCLAYNIDDVDKFIAANFSADEYEIYYKSKKSFSKHWNGNKRFEFMRFFDEANSQRDLHASLFADLRTRSLPNNKKSRDCPIFSVKYMQGHQWRVEHGLAINPNTRQIITLNCNLKLYEFYRLFDAKQAYQELSMYLGGLASPEKDIPFIDDKTMAEAKGFDKFSFRKDKTKK